MNNVMIPQADQSVSPVDLPLTHWESPADKKVTVVEIHYNFPRTFNTVTLDELPQAAGRLTGVTVFWQDLQGTWRPAHMVGQQDCSKLPVKKNFYFQRLTTQTLRLRLAGTGIRLEQLNVRESVEFPVETGLLELEPNVVPNPGQAKMVRDGYTMFLHFGLNTFAGQEWTFGDRDPSLYAPQKIDADQWIRTAWEAGMNSVILVTKHHDGFSLWNSRFTDYSVGNPASGSHVDVLEQVSNACNKYGINMGVYYSAWDNNWDRKHGKENDAEYCQYMRDQIGEIMSGKYGLKDETGRGRISELWIDGNWEKAAARWEFDKLYDHVKRLQPDCQVGLNWTVGADIHNYIPIRCQKEGDPIHYWCSDIRLGDGQESGDQDPKLFTYRGQTYYLPFEATLILNCSWFWHPGYGDKPSRAPESIVEKYRKYRSEGNILVLNCGPNREGRLEQADIDSLYAAARILGIARGSAKEA